MARGDSDDDDDDPDLGRAVIEDLARAAFPDGKPAPGPREPVPPPSVVDLSIGPTGARRVTGSLVVAIAVVTVLSAAVAYGDPDLLTVGLTLLLVIALVTTWWFHSRRRAVTVVVTGSRLEIRDGGLHVFDLSRTDPPVDVIGLPRDQSWRVLFHRRGMRPYVVDASMVDPVEFMRMLHARRPEVHYRPE
jgi:hypothetical protein